MNIHNKPDYQKDHTGNAQMDSARIMFWQKRALSGNKISDSKQMHETLRRKINEYSMLNVKLQAERAKLENERELFREMIESEQRAIDAAKKGFDRAIIDMPKASAEIAAHTGRSATETTSNSGSKVQRTVDSGSDAWFSDR